jgi:HD-GYP domain-containing protein (c-di-GMP phosphodiesterase class II)
MGDNVLRKTGEVLRSGRRPSDVVCRYGGEEFCILLPHTNIEDTYLVAEHVREAIEKADFDGLSITASIGVSARSLGASGPQQMIDQADQCLYVAKRHGRNMVVRYDEAAEQIEADQATRDSSNPAGTGSSEPFDGEAPGDPTIPFHAVTALLAALAFRDQATAEHSRRVADYCVLTADGLMTSSECYVLEIAGLLHDVGKVGVPDSILLKPGKLSDEEWKIMVMHERIGVEIVQATFSNPDLAETVRTHHAWYSGKHNHPELPTSDAIPLGARILAIADAYDAMTSEQVYRRAFSREEAFLELRRCAVQQFDPQLVEHFIDVVTAQNRSKDARREKSKAVAISFGTQIERLTDALQNQDIEGVATLAHRMNLTAIRYNSPEIARVASQLENVCHADADIKGLVEVTNELLGLCRFAQRAYLDDAAGAPVVRGSEDISSEA